MKTFPVMLNVQGRLAVVVGGGPVGLRKARSLSQAGARVLLVAPQIKESQVTSGIEIVRAGYRDDLLHGALLVFACTDEGALNARIAADARKAGALVNAADQPEDCDFFLPAVVADGEVVIAIGTGGASPALAVQLKDRLAAALPKRIGEFASLLSELRKALKSKVSDAARRGEIMKRLSTEQAYEKFLSGGREAIGKILVGLL